MITYVCNKCRKAISFDDVEVIEIEPVRSKILFEDEDMKVLEAYGDSYKKFKDTKENIHLCGECKGEFYDFI